MYLSSNTQLYIVIAIAPMNIIIWPLKMYRAQHHNSDAYN